MAASRFPAAPRSRWTAVLALSLLLAACGGGASSASSAAPASAATNKPTTGSSPAAVASAKPALDSAAPSAPASAVAKPNISAAANGPIKVGFIVPLTGPFTRNGMDARDGWQTYMGSINNTVSGRQVQTIVVDDVETQPDAALAKAKQLVEDQKVNALAGIVATPVCYAVAGYVKQAQVPLLIAADCAAQDLTTNEKYVSPYLTRFTTINSAQSDTAADWATGAGYKKAIVMTLDYGAGIESSDLFASAFIARGGTVVQELHPPLGTNDYGPYLAQMTADADLLANFIPGADGLKFGQQYKNYLGQRKLQILDIGAGSTSGTNFTQLGDQTIGMIAEAFYSQAYDAPANQAFIKQWKDKNPNSPISEEVATAT